MGAWTTFKKHVSEITNISDQIDTTAAERTIRSNIFFKGPNVWILAFAIMLASVGLNVNSTAVIIGAMLVSPLMGPIFGLGLGLGISDTVLLKDSLKNLLIMVGISVMASFLYFLLTPLDLANPTELLARTNPTIFDVFIAVCGGFAGIIETCRKEKGTVFAGVAIATALMPPLCTAGFGLASGNFSYFFGALYLFLINCTFITLATYATVKYLHFTPVEYGNQDTAKKSKKLISAVIVIIIIPSIWSAFVMVKENRFEQNVESFINSNKSIDSRYLYDYKISHHKGSKVEVMLYGDVITDEKRRALIASAESFGIKENQLIISQHGAEEQRSDQEIIKSLFERTDKELQEKENEIRDLKEQISIMRAEDIPYIQIAKEISNQYSNIIEVTVSKGSTVDLSELSHKDNCLLLVKTTSPLDDELKVRLADWLKVRINVPEVTVVEIPAYETEQESYTPDQTPEEAPNVENI